MTEKREFLRKSSFRSNRFFYMVVIQKLITTTEIFDFYANFFFEVSFKFLRNLSKTRKFAMRLNFKFLRNRVTITIYPQTILNICYYSKSISRRYLKILPFLISYSYSDLKIIRIYRHNFFLLAFEVEILTKIRQNHEYLQIIFVMIVILNISEKIPSFAVEIVHDLKLKHRRHTQIMSYRHCHRIMKQETIGLLIDRLGLGWFC
ncbi:hypothetical protein AGLY_006962 [Aphis glycines]|uniref:Uncharacterized protein n=1 Tax=Aphis glycines TaxID=307491 RepID=A0A6G0TQL3_APHGL|nr:hypothetical protein AGLY_006962 [Aphis glycines]